MLNLKKKNKDDDSKDAKDAKKEENEEKVEKEEKVETEENREKENVELPVKEVKKEVSRNEIDTLKSDVDNLSSELNSAVGSLKKSVVDIRSAVSEIENPFNLLRAIQGEKEVQDLNHERLPKGVKSLILPVKEEPSKTEESKALDEPPKPETEHKPKEALPVEPTKPQITPQPSTQPQTQPPKGTSDYLDWVWAHIDSGLTADDIFALAKSYEFLGYLPEKFGEGIYHLARAAEKMKAGGFNKKHLLLNMYQAASISGIQIGMADVNKLISLVEDKPKSRTGTVTEE